MIKFNFLDVLYCGEYLFHVFFFQVSAAVCFLLSPAATLISGETVKVDGAGSLYGSIWEIPGLFYLKLKISIIHCLSQRARFIYCKIIKFEILSYYLDCHFLDIFCSHQVSRITYAEIRGIHTRLEIFL